MIVKTYFIRPNISGLLLFVSTYSRQSRTVDKNPRKTPCIHMCVVFGGTLVRTRTENLMTRAWPENGSGGGDGGRDMSGPPPGRRVAVYACLPGRRAGGLGWLAGWLSRTRRRRAWPPATVARAAASTWAPDRRVRKIAENARKRRFQFPENRGKSGLPGEKNSSRCRRAPGLGAPFFAAAAVSILLLYM